MKQSERILLGMAGALMPIIATLYFYDFSNFSATTFNWISYAVRTTILLGLGALTAHLHNTETNKLKILQLGLAVPSLLTAVYTGNNLKETQLKHEIEERTRAVGYQLPAEEFSFPFFSSAYAQGRLPHARSIQKFKSPDQSLAQSIWQGVTGSGPENIWYVIVSSHKTLEEAQAKVAEINRLGLNYKAEIYDPYKSNVNYSVIIGSNLILDDAKKLRTKAIADGLAKDTYLWSLK